MATEAPVNANELPPAAEPGPDDAVERDEPPEAESDEDPLHMILQNYNVMAMEGQLDSAKKGRDELKRQLKKQTQEVRNQKRRTDRLKKKALGLPKEHILDILAFVQKNEQRRASRGLAKAKAKAKAKATGSASAGSSRSSTAATRN